MMTVKTYDTKSYDLAEHFLESEPHLNTKNNRHELALAIQQAVEDWCESARDKYEPPDPPGFEGGFAANHSCALNGQEMRIERVWAMPSKWTFDVTPIKSLVQKYAGDGVGWADPFAGQSVFAQHRNDLNPSNNQPSCMEASDFLAQFADHSLSGVIFDPPYSVTQVSRSYEEMGYKFNGRENPTGGFPLVRDHIRRIVKPEGYVISFGWNTTGVGTGRDFDIREILIVAHGGNRNDTLCTVEQKSPQMELSLAGS